MTTWTIIEEMMAKIGIAGTAIFGAWKIYQKFFKPAFYWCKAQLSLSKKVNSLESILNQLNLSLHSFIKLYPYPFFKADSISGNIIYANSALLELLKINESEIQSWMRNIKEIDKIKYLWDQSIEKKISFNETFTLIDKTKEIKVNCKTIYPKDISKYNNILGIIIKV